MIERQRKIERQKDRERESVYLLFESLIYLSPCLFLLLSSSLLALSVLMFSSFCPSRVFTVIKTGLTQWRNIHVLSCLVLSYVLSCLMSCLVLCLVLSYVLSCLMSCLVL